MVVPAGGVAPGVSLLGEPSGDAVMMQLDDENSQVEDGQGHKREGSPVGRPATKRLHTGPSPATKRAFNDKFDIIDAGGGGACGYNSFAVACALVRGKRLDEIKGQFAAMGTTVRIQIAEHIKRHEDVYRADWVPDTEPVEGADDGPAPATWQEWLNSLVRPRRWICQLSLVAGAKRCGVKIVVLQKESDGKWGNPIIMGQSRKKELPVVLGFDASSKHYVVLLPTKGKDSFPVEWLIHKDEDSTLPRSQNMLRGACRHSEKDWLPNVTPSSKQSVSSGSQVEKKRKENGSRPVLLTWCRSRTPSSKTDKNFCGPPTSVRGGKGCRGSSVSVLEDQFLEENPAAISTDVPIADKKVGPKCCPLVWTCSLCNTRFESSESNKLSATRSNHLVSVHPGQTKFANQRRQKCEIIFTSPLLPVEERDWTCVWCGEGLPLLGKWQREKSITAHLAQRHPRKKNSPGSINSARGKLYRKNKDALPQMKAGKASLATKMSQRAAAGRDWHAGGHNLVEDDGVDFSKWKSIHAAKCKPNQFTLLTCTKCFVIGRSRNKWIPCKGRGVPSTKAMKVWCSMHETNQNALCKDSGVAQEEADKYFCQAQAAWRADDVDLKGHSFVEIPLKPGVWPFKAKRPPAYIYTCVSCRLVRQHIQLSNLSECRGLENGPHVLQRNWWKKLGKNLALKKILATVWKCSVKEANAWLRREMLLQDGDVEANPGPRCTKISVLSLNTGGCPGVWRALSEWIKTKQIDVLCVQEVCAEDNAIVALRKSAIMSGYHMYWQPGIPKRDRWNNLVARGGVALFVKVSLPQRPGFVAQGLNTQVVTAWVAGWLTGSAYSPPCEHAPTELGHLLFEQFESCGF